MKKVIIILFTAVLMVFGFADRAKAYPITIQIEAVVDSVIDEGTGDGYLDGQINVGDTITGYYTYESTTADTNPSDYVGGYYHYSSPCGVFLSVGGFNFQSNPNNIDFLVQVVNSGGPYTSDSYSIGSSSNLPLSNGTLVDKISWALTDETGSALIDYSLPVIPPDLNNWQVNVLTIAADRAYGIQAHIISAVPEPATFLLFGIGGLLLKRKS